jgi:beta-lactamase class A
VLSFAAAPAAARRHPAPTPSPSPSPSPSPTPLPERLRVARLRTTVAAIAKSAPGRLGVAIVDLYHDTRISVRGDQSFELGNVRKLAIALAAYRRSDQHRLDLDRRFVRNGVAHSYAELIAGMLLERDNTATDVLLANLGGPKATGALVARLGLRGFDFERSEATPNAVADLLAGLTQQYYTKLDTTNECLQLLSDVRTDGGRFRAGLPAGASLAHETGTSNTVDGATAATNDAGILTLPDGRRIVLVAFLADSHANPGARDTTLARIARAVYETYVP